jgi:hypothetical protein
VGVADLMATLPPPSLPSHRRSSWWLLLLRASLPLDVVARPEGTVDVPHHHRDVVLSRLVVTWRHGVVFVVAGVGAVVVVGGRTVFSGGGCWWTGR